MIAPLILFALGSLLLWLGWRSRRKLRASMSWPCVTGRVTDAGVRENFTRRNGQSAAAKTYTPVVQYNFQVGAHTYHGHRLAFQTRSFGSTRKAVEVLRRFPIGGPVQVFHDPNNPRDCVVEREAASRSALTVVGSLALAAAMALAIM